MSKMILTKIPRHKGVVCCYSLEQWCARLALTHLMFFFCTTIFFFYLSQDEVYMTIPGMQGYLVVSGLLSIFAMVISATNITGLLLESTKILRYWVIGALVGNGVLTLILFGLFIYICVACGVGYGFLSLFFFVIIIAYFLYTVVVVNTVRMDYVDKKANPDEEENNTENLPKSDQSENQRVSDDMESVQITQE